VKDQKDNSKLSPAVSPEEVPAGQQRAQIGCLLRLLWMFAGNIGLLAAAAAISNQPAWTYSIMDGAFLLIVLALIGVRYADITWFEGTTAKNEPATRTHFVRYTIGLLLFAGLIWFVAHSI